MRIHHKHWNRTLNKRELQGIWHYMNTHQYSNIKLDDRNSLQRALQIKLKKLFS